NFELNIINKGLKDYNFNNFNYIIEEKNIFNIKKSSKIERQVEIYNSLIEILYDSNSPTEDLAQENFILRKFKEKKDR
ncbi:MAG: hypothetical protein AABW52_01005, partial [Nanoarchaeota archaeon]